MNIMSPRPTATTSDPVPAPNFKRAVAAAVKAFAKTGRMLDAALAYAEHGVSVFPVGARHKNPIAARLRDESGKPIDGTGGFKRATTDPVQIGKWWKRHEHLIGIPMGPLSGVWCADIDTKAGGHHDDGLAPWKTLQDKHGAIKTRQHVTASGGLHEFFKWSYQRPVTCRRGDIPKGIDIKGLGGYIIAPPGKRNGSGYAVTIDTAPTDAPAWLYELIEAGRSSAVTVYKPRDPSKPSNPYIDFAAIPSRNKDDNRNSALADIADLAAAIEYIENDDWDWDTWTAYGLAIYAATGGSEEGFALFDKLSRKSSDKYHETRTRQRWLQFHSSPPTQTGAGKLYAAAVANGWRTKPTYAPADASALDDARPLIASEMHKFLNRNAYHLFADSALGAAVNALRIDTGVGKTTAALDAIAASDKTFHYAVPTRELAIEIVNLLRGRGVNARTFFGRNAPDLESPGDSLCRNLDPVELAVEAKLDVTKACCKRGDEVCPLYDECGYWRQGRDADDVRVWVFTADYLFHRNDVLGTADVLIIDERFWPKQLRGISDVDEDERDGLPLLNIGKSDELRRLGEILNQQPDDGGLQLTWARYADVLSLDELIAAQWDEMPDFELRPGMTGAELKAHLRRSGRALKRIAYLHFLIKLLKELRHMIFNGITVSGRLQLKTSESGSRMITWRGIEMMKTQFNVPTLILDATLPNIDILRVSHSNVALKADVRVPFPDAVRVVQVTNTPTSKTKLVMGDAAEKHRYEVLRYIQRRFIETGREPSLVIVQKEFESWLNDKLPPGVTAAHFNNIAGLDAHKNARLLILIGRPMPGPAAVESIAATLSGEMPDCIEGDGFTWYERVRQGIRLKDGTGAAVIGDVHPDPLCESVRQQITEAELLQALGRARGVIRTDDTPLDVDLLFDVVLPIEVNQDEPWEKPSLFYSTAIDGVMLESPSDMLRIWPNVWNNLRAAERTIANGVPDLPGFDPVRYAPQGRNQKSRIGHFDRSLIPDPVRWLEDRLGPLRAKP